MKVEVLRNVFAKNEHAAQNNRRAFDERGILCVNLLGGAGAGKTSVLEAVLPILRRQARLGVMEGDLATTRDADRIAALDVPVVQLLTEGGCHLNATLVEQGLKRLPLGDIDILVIENVGNPICPANFDLGEHLRLSVLSVTEGDDKPSKYPLLFRNVSAVLLTKCDLLPHVRFDIAAVTEDLRRLNPEGRIFRTDLRTGQGFGDLADWILSHRRRPA